MVNKNQDLVSVITPAYNSSRFILETIRSVQSQTHTNWEMLIVDDCSKDNTVQLVKAEVEKDPRIKLFTLEQNSGSAVARNTAIQNAKGKYIAFLDSDDLWKPEKLEKQLKFIKENDYAFTFTGYEEIDVNGTPINKVFQTPESVSYKDILKRPGTIGCLTVMINKEKFDDVLMPNIRTRQDFALWLKLLKTGIRAYSINEPLSKYRLVPGSISSNKIKAAQKNWYVYRKIEKLNLISAAWYFSNYAIYNIKKRLF